ncbi:14679_t:CDS:1 [Entrophospora sp. SA101]|nr:1734_t:CDS:1 [Entrophospora sp. SA101]CAJ0642041.1 12185_t:CDS:1 [Entrophospora sp. SA101]CAJ0744950.1 12037_t:CDS:1 [Entrophospora sp. SA101]CAJ0750945.1 14679_t:CDS:1 [Entrophospora sp. SA101]CAJ0829475.1 10528_t:CDS:1 [Entrophospora sp. SA101]
MNDFIQLTGTTQDYGIVENLRSHAINYKNINKTLEAEKGELIKQEHALSAQNDKLEKYIENLQQSFDQEKKRIVQRCNESDAELKELKKKFKDVNEEASRYKSALGKGTNLRWGEDDSAQLQQTISELQKALSEFTDLKARDIVINEEEADKLLANYNCAAVFNSKTGKTILSAALQRLILDVSFSEITEYLEKSNLTNRNDNLESDVNLAMKSLVGLAQRLAETREGDDDIANITPAKVRQQVCTVLGTRGFCKENHTFIETLSDKIINNVSLYRPFKSNEKDQIKVTTMNLIKDIAHLYFRLNAQQPIPKFRDFFNGGIQIQSNFMEGTWDENDIKNLEVEVCSFPLIYSKTDDSQKVLHKAQVITRPKLKLRK